MIVRDIESALAQAVQRAQEAGDLPTLAVPELALERPQQPEHGDYASSLPLRLARTAHANPLDIAQAIVSYLPSLEAVASVQVAPPGFINFRLAEAWLARQVDAILAQGEAFGELQLGLTPDGHRQRVQVEFVSANPTGPLTVGNGRGLALGDTLANVLAAAGYETEREYLVNDAGTQTQTFAATLYARYQQLFPERVSEVLIPEGGYPGEYMLELAREIAAEHGDAFLRPAGEPYPQELHDLGVQKMVARIRDDLAVANVHYDVWFSEHSLYTTSAELRKSTFEIAMGELAYKGLVAEKEGAVWFTPAKGELAPGGLAAPGEDKDNVLVRSSGAPTYFASDIAYHYDKFLVRGFDRVIDIWGADHQGHVPRMLAAVAALGVDPERLTIIIYQLVTLRRGQELVRLSKRSGDIVTLREIINEVSADAARFFFLQRAAHTHMDFDLELAKRQSAENPVYYVQYAHARIAGILAHAAERVPDYGDGDVSLLAHEAELDLIRKLLMLPELIEAIARSLEPHQLPYYALDLATAFHDFYEKCRVVSDDLALSKARLKLVAACKLVLARTFRLMGMTAPERM